MEYLNKPKQNHRSSYGEGEPREFSVGFIPHKSGTYKIEIDSIIESVSQFSTAIQILECAKEDDEVVIYLQTDGGSVNAGEAFIHAMRKCSAPIHIVATGGVHSMGTHILLEADSIELSNGFNALIHCGSDGAWGRVNEYRAKTAFDTIFRDKQFKEAYEGMLSESEIQDVLDGKDIWLDANGWLDRATARSEYFKAKYEAFQAEEDAAELEEVPVAVVAKKPRKRKTLAIVNKDVDTTPEE